VVSKERILVPLVLDLRIAHDRVGSSTDPNLNGHLKYHRETDRFFFNFRSFVRTIRSWILPLPPCVFLCPAENQCWFGSAAKAVSLRITINLDGVSITSRTHTHPSHSQTSRLLTSSLSLGVPVPRATQCIRDS
jgi:hypothetical protein